MNQRTDWNSLDPRGAEAPPAIGPGVPATLGRFTLVGVLPSDSSQQLAALWRGALAARFPQDADFHGHEGTRTLYRYPPVQYRWTDEGPQVLLIDDAGAALRGQDLSGETLILGGNRLRIKGARWEALTLQVALAATPQRYRFAAPWLALNQDNAERFNHLKDAERLELLQRILVGNLLSTCKGLGWNVPAKIAVRVEDPRELVCSLKGLPLRGFLATFSCNLHLSAGLALGRSVSHGFGWIERAT